MANENISLDDYIRRKKGQTVSLMDMRKKEKEVIDQDELDEDLDEIMIRNSLRAQGKTVNGLSKFDRIRISEDRNDADDEDMENPSIKFAKEINKMDHPQCCQAKPFYTIENKQKVKLQSQQWRLRNNGNQSNTNGGGIRSGRVDKNRRQNDTKFINRGGFTKVLQVNGDDGNILGIVRNQRRNFNNNNNNNNRDMPKIEINMNWRGFFEGAQKHFPNMTPAPTTIPSISIPSAANGGEAVNVNMQITANELMEFLHNKKQSEQKAAMPYAEMYAREAGIDFMKDEDDDFSIGQY